ncbi:MULTISPECIES: hypothetical protein [unclassified Nonomuraea]|nr:hypothetical protein [Nonomuraea sp. 3-1Str]
MSDQDAPEPPPDEEPAHCPRPEEPIGAVTEEAQMPDGFEPL